MRLFKAFHGVEPHGGAIFLFFEITRCGSVQCLFFGNRTVRCGPVFTFSKSYGAVPCVAVRCGADDIF